MATPAAHTLRKTERLCGKKDISTLFSKGKWGATAHLRYCWLKREMGRHRASALLLDAPQRGFRSIP